MVDVDALEPLLRGIEDTGDHPLNGAECPGRHRAAWTVARVHVDACRPLEIGRRHAHREPSAPWAWDGTQLARWDGTQLARRMTNAVRRRAMYPVRW